LKEYKTPFVVAATKIDRLRGWNAQKETPFIESIQKQRDDVKTELDEGIYKLVGQLSERGFNSERYDRVDDFKKQIAIVPVSSITGEGIADLLTVLAGLSQQFLTDRLQLSEIPHGTVLEVKETKGFGPTIDVILYDGVLKKNDTLVIGGREPVVTKIKALLRPRPLQEIRLEKQFEAVDEVHAATGIKIAAPNLENVISGSPIVATSKESEVESLKSQVRKEVEEVQFTKEVDGITIVADTLGSLEAMIKILTEEGLPIRKAKVGVPLKQDIVELESSSEDNRVLLAFNAQIPQEVASYAKDLNIAVFSSDIIYRLMDEYRLWTKQREDRKKEGKYVLLTWPGKVRFIRGATFRQSHPAIFGVDVLGGKIKPGYMLMSKDGTIIGKIKQLQKESKDVQEAKTNDKVAVSIEGITIGRHVNEGDTLYVDAPLHDLEIMQSEFADKLAPNDFTIIDEIRKIKQPSR
ncbi:translation initiation factor IF-2, partial [archaeon]